MVDVRVTGDAVGAVEAPALQPPVRARRNPHLRLRLLVGDTIALTAAWSPEIAVGTAGGAAVRSTSLAIIAIWCTLVATYWLGLYRSRVCARPVEASLRMLVAALAGLAGAAGVEWLRHGTPVPAPVPSLALATVALFAVRWRLTRWLRAQRAEGRFLRTIVLVGRTDQVGSVCDLLDAEPELGYRVGAIATPTGDGGWRELPRGTPDTIQPLATQAGASGVILVAGALDPAAAEQVVRRAMDHRLHVQLWPGVECLASWRLRVSPICQLPAFYVEPHRIAPWQAVLKRTIDIVLSAVLLAVLAPLMGTVAVLVKAQDGGPVCYRSRRVGRRGALIWVTKFRTMVPDAASMLDAVAALNERQGGPLFKASADPRVTRLGAALRASSIDELPQLFDVLRGAMSLVGPRPALPSEVEQFDEDFQRRHDMRPGITGLWQVEARDNPSFRAYRRLDLTYVDNWHPWLDFAILVTTAHAVTVRGLHLLRRSLRLRRRRERR